MLDKLHFAHAGETCAASAAWSHRAGPLDARKLADQLDWLTEVHAGHELAAVFGRGEDYRPVRPDRPRRTRKPEAIVQVGGRGHALQVLARVQELVGILRPPAGPDFRETVLDLAAELDGREVEPGQVWFPIDGSRLRVADHAAWPEGWEPPAPGPSATTLRAAWEDLSKHPLFGCIVGPAKAAAGGRIKDDGEFMELVRREYGFLKRNPAA